MSSPANIAFSIENLDVSYRQGGGELCVVKDVSLQLREGEILGVAGESGCGKSTAVLASTGFPIPGMTSRNGRALLGGTDLLQLNRKELRKFWGRQIAYLPQDASTSLTPTAKVNRLFAETLRVHLGLDRQAIRERTRELMDSVGLPVDRSTLKRYPFEFSGGQQQRLALAMALACKPQVLILDEPTTGLDVTTQAVVSALVRELVDKSGTATIYVSHDLRLLRHLCDRIAVMYAGQIVELADAGTIWEWPRHPYTSALLEAVPDVSGDRQVVPIPGAPPAGVVTNACSFVPRCPIALEACGTDAVVLETIDRTLVRCIRAHETDRIRAGTHSGRVLGRPASASPDPVLHLDEVTCRYGSASTPAVDAVTLDVRGSEILGVVGESGSGKSTLLRCIIGLRAQATGRMTYRGDPLPFGLGRRSNASVRGIQMVFQNPASSLNPRQTVRTILGRPIDMFRKDDLSGTYDQELASLMDSVRLGTRFLDRYPGELSGGQQQRVALARALAASPDLVLCDEIVSSLDVSVQASILDLVHALRTERGVSFVFVTHDLGVVRSIADRIIVMQRGIVVETEETERLFENPQHDYTMELVRASRLNVESDAAEVQG